MKIILFTNQSTHGVEILKALHANGIQLEAIFLETMQAGSYRKRLKRMAKEVGYLETGRFLLGAVIKRYISNRDLLKPNFYQQYAEKVYTVANFNGDDCQRLMNEIQPDLLILGGARILKDHILRIPKVGVLNAHPGLLPKYRGVDVIPWAIYQGDAVGVTVHVVDTGVDTGSIVLQRELEIGQGDKLADVRRQAEVLAGKLMAEAVQKIIAEGGITAQAQSFVEGQQYYKMPRELLNEVEKILTSPPSPLS